METVIGCCFPCETQLAARPARGLRLGREFDSEATVPQVRKHQVEVGAEIRVPPRTIELAESGQKVWVFRVHEVHVVVDPDTLRVADGKRRDQPQIRPELDAKSREFQRSERPRSRGFDHVICLLAKLGAEDEGSSVNYELPHRRGPEG